MQEFSFPSTLHLLGTRRARPLRVTPPRDAVADIGHVHLKVSDIDRAIGFYCDVLGMQLKNVTDEAAFLAFGG
jgi:catechol 2,3-dioxygenase